MRMCRHRERQVAALFGRRTLVSLVHIHRRRHLILNVWRGFKREHKGLRGTTITVLPGGAVPKRLGEVYANTVREKLLLFAADDIAEVPGTLFEYQTVNERAIVKLFRRTMRLAKAENKIPVVTLSEYRQKGIIMIVRQGDLKAVMTAMGKVI